VYESTKLSWEIFQAYLKSTLLINHFQGRRKIKHFGASSNMVDILTPLVGIGLTDMPKIEGQFKDNPCTNGSAIPEFSSRFESYDPCYAV
jgi:hypothetical protein